MPDLIGKENKVYKVIPSIRRHNGTIGELWLHKTKNVTYFWILVNSKNLTTMKTKSIDRFTNVILNRTQQSKCMGGQTSKQTTTPITVGKITTNATATEYIIL